VSAGAGTGLDPALMERIDVFRGRTYTVEPLPGGLTNRNYKVTTAGEAYVVRHSTPASADELAVDRRAEYENSVRAADAGVGAPEVAYRPDDNILVIGWLEGETLTDSEARAEAIAKARGLTWVHPYDDEAVIAGQGTVALEIFEEVPDLDVLVVPIGGGGLIAGIAIAAKSVRPDLDIVGVEAALYPSMWNAIKGENRPIGGPTLAEGIAVKNVGRLTLPVVRALVSDILLVSEPDLERAVNTFATRQKTMAEGAGAAGLAAMLAEPERFRGRKVGLVLCGGNIDPRILATIMVRALERENRIVGFRLTIPDRPGVLGHIATRLGELGANILEVEHRRLLLDVPAKGARLDVTIETRDSAHAQAILAALVNDGYQPVRVDAADLW